MGVRHNLNLAGLDPSFLNFSDSCSKPMETAVVCPDQPEGALSTWQGSGVHPGGSSAETFSARLVAAAFPSVSGRACEQPATIKRVTILYNRICFIILLTSHNVQNLPRLSRRWQNVFVSIYFFINISFI